MPSPRSPHAQHAPQSQHSPHAPHSPIPPLDPLGYAPTPERPLRAKLRRLAARTRVVPHQHPWAQVAMSSNGVIRMTAGHGTYLVPPSRALWIPPGVEHAVTVVEDAEIRTLYVHRGARFLHDGGAPPATPFEMWPECRVLEVSPLLRELVGHLDVAPGAGAGAASERERRLGDLVLDELRRAAPVRLGLALPADKRLRALCERVVDDPLRHATLDGWARDAGASARTLARLFRQELGTTFGEWRQQARLAQALALAADKKPMNLIAAELGYASASAFSAMVRRTLGTTPSRFLGHRP
ncbi:MAG: helix-turn-helix transcriptional regulator [Proteobacteria bacterium]|nr:helix-turn-helix transcriptional regulator [Pseudomonadota bacterium]